MGHDLRRRLSRAERLLPAAIEGQLKRREQSKQRLSSLARVHATAVAGIVLVGGPKIDEPWTSALARAVAQYQRTDRVLEQIETLTEYFHANMGANPGKWGAAKCSNKTDDADGANNTPKKPIGDMWEDLVKATEQMKHRIMNGKSETERFTEIFRTAPIEILKVTQTAVDAKLLGFDILDLSAAADGREIGLRDAFRWPLLPLGVLTKGSPIAAQVTDVSDEDCLFVGNR